jgi:hypothetical protein
MKLWLEADPARTAGRIPHRLLNVNVKPGTLWEMA